MSLLLLCGAIVVTALMVWALMGVFAQTLDPVTVERSRRRLRIAGYAAFNYAAISALAVVALIIDSPDVYGEVAAIGLIVISILPAVTWGLLATALLRLRDPGLVILSVMSLGLLAWKIGEVFGGLSPALLNECTVLAVIVCVVVTIVAWVRGSAYSGHGVRSKA